MKYLLCGWLILLGVMSLSAQHSLDGTITDENGEPLPGAYIMLDEIARTTTTDEDGFFRFNKLDKGQYTLIVTYLSYQKQEQKIDIDGEKSIEFSLVPSSFKMEAVEVLSTWADKETPVTYTNLNKEAIEKNNLGQDVPYLLRWTPSTIVTSDAGTGIGYTGIRIRGSDPTRINVTINGIPLNDAESQGTFWVDLPDFVSSTEGIQIQRGVGTSTNGAGAFGATINLNTAKVHKSPYFTTANSIGSFNTLKNNIQVGSGLLGGQFTLDGRVSRIVSDGYIDRASAKLNSFFFSGAMLDDKQSLRLNVFSGHEVTYQAWNGVPAQYVNDERFRTFNSAGMEKAGTPHDNEVDDYRQTHYQLILKRQLNSHLNLDGAVHYTRGKGFFEQYKADEDPVDYNISGDEATDLIRRRWLDNHFYGLTYGLTYNDREKITATLGGALSNYQGRHFGEVIWTGAGGQQETPPIYYDNDASKLDFNIFGKINYCFAQKLNGYLDLQYRLVNYDFVGFNAQGASTDQNDQLHFFNPKLGLFYQLGQQQQLYVSFGVAHREPNRNDYTESSTLSRPQSERLLNTELGYRFQGATAYLGVNAFHMQYNDQLVLTGQINDVGEATRINVADSYRLGLEIEGGLQLAKGFQLNSSATFSTNKVASFTEYIDNWDTWEQETVEHTDTDLAFSPSVIWSGELSYNLLEGGSDQEELTVGFSSKFVGEQFIDNTSNKNTRLSSYSFSDLRIQYSIRPKAMKELTFRLLIRNFFDQKFSTNAWTYRYRSPSYDGRGDDPSTRLENAGTSTYNLTGFYPQAGRNLLFGVTLGF